MITQFKEELPEKTIWVWTGYTFHELVTKMANCRIGDTNEWALLNDILCSIDVLVDGPFVEAKKNLKLLHRGSSNQRVIDMKKTIEKIQQIRFKSYRISDTINQYDHCIVLYEE